LLALTNTHITTRRTTPARSAAMSANERVYSHRPLGHSLPPPPHPSQQSHPPPGALVHPPNGGPGGGIGPGPSGPPNGAVVASQTAQAGAARLHDLLDFVKAEFEALAGEGAVLRGQREEFEGMSE